MTSDSKRFDVVGIGNAIVDVLVQAEEAFLDDHGLHKGTMALVDESQAERLYASVGPGLETSGGSAANTLAGIAQLGGRAAFIGRVRDDQLGAIFSHDIRSVGATYTTPPAGSGPSTARCLILVTPDAQRTMCTYLGASVNLDPADLDLDLVAQAKVLYLEGYLWDSALSTRLNDPKTGAFVVIQQRLSEEDLTGHILEKDSEGWTHLCLPMRYEPERSFVTSIGWEDPRKEAGDLLWPERFGEAEVKTLERQLGPYAAAGQLQQRPEPKGGGVIKREWWQLWDAATYPPMDYVIASLDTAYTTKTENDFSALSIWGVFSGDVVAQAQKAEGREIVRSYNDKQSPKVTQMGGELAGPVFREVMTYALQAQRVAPITPASRSSR